jgi:hypothetical protein
MGCATHSRSLALFVCREMEIFKFMRSCTISHPSLSLSLTHDIRWKEWERAREISLHRCRRRRLSL